MPNKPKERLWKWLCKGRVSPYADYQWPKVGEWVKAKGKLSVCHNGIHVCRKDDLEYWINAELYEIEVGGERIDADDKVVVRRARLVRRVETWNDRTARLFAADCAEHVLLLFEAKYPDDKRPRLAIKAARDYANGKIIKKQLAAARDAAWAAERKWQTARLMSYLYPEEKPHA